MSEARAHSAIRDRLVAEGRRILQEPPKQIAFAKDHEADRLLNDLAGHPHAFVLACIMDRQIKAEFAWVIPYRIGQRLNDVSFEGLRRLSLEGVQRLMSAPSPLHRFVNEMAVNFHAAVQRIGDAYGGDASRIWSGRPSSADVIYRFLGFRGVGPKIATMATNIFARELKVPFSDYYSIDVSADVHVKRVFVRLGLCGADASVEEVVYRARALHPEFPGLMDLPVWKIGRAWCRPTHPLCDDCLMQDVCPTASDRVRKAAPA
jgi:endonuclease III